MRISHILVFAFVFVLSSLNIARAEQAPTVKEWTFLVFLNGNNNLDSFGAKDINEMEKVGSTSNINVVVQWASMAESGVKRLYVQKDNDASKVTSPTVDRGNFDMGDWHSIVDFVKWAHKNYPAKRYFIDVWDHGSGWHLNRSGIGIKDISWDDKTGHYMTTEQLGLAIKESAAVIGHKVDIYGSDACLMAMPEVAGEMADAVESFIGAEEVEPADGWPYDTFLQRWAASPTASSQDVSKILVEEYVKSYQGGSQGTQDVTLSAFDLGKMSKFSTAVRGFGAQIQKLDKAARAKVIEAADDTQKFTNSDYADLGHFLELAGKLGVMKGTDELRQALGDFVIANGVTSGYSTSKGLSIWLPTSKYTYNAHIARYRNLGFHATSSWGDALGFLLQD